jgi:PAS domain S-box-containing protein
MQAEEKYLSIFENAVEGIYQSNPEGRFIAVNPAMAKILGYESPDDLLEKLTDINQQYYTSPADRAEYRRFLAMQGLVQDFETKVFRKDGGMIWISTNARAVRDSYGALLYYEGFVVDISARKRAEETLRFLMEFQKVVTSISTQFINPMPSEIDTKINHALQRIGEFAGVDRSYVLLFSGNGKKMEHTHEWCAPGVEPHVQRLKGIEVEKAFPWFSKALEKKDIVHVPRVYELPDEALSEKQALQLEKVQSLLLVPMVPHGSLIGFIGFDSVRERKEWSEESISLLKNVGEIFANVLEYKWAIEALALSEERYRRLVEFSPEMITVLSQNRIVYVNPAGIKLLGASGPEELIGKPIFDFIHPDYWDTTKERIRILKEGKEAPLIEEEFIRLDGKTVEVEVTSTPFNYQGQPGVLAVVRNITERKRAEEALRESEERYKQLVDNATDVIYRIDINGNFTYFNPVAMKMLEYSEEELIGKHYLELIRPDYREGAQRFYRSQLAEKILNTYFEFPVISKYGKEIWLGQNVRSNLEGDRLVGFQAIARDITSRKQMEEELKRLAQENATMAEIGRIIGSTLDTEEVYERFAQEVRKLIPCDKLTISVINRKAGTFTCAHVEGSIVQGRMTGQVVPLPGTAAQEIMRSHSSLLIRKENLEEAIGRWPGLLPAFKAGMQSMMFVPLISKDQVIGALNILSTRANAYTERDVKRAESIAGQIAGAIANSNLYFELKRAEEALRESERRYRLLAENASDLIWTMDTNFKCAYVSPSIQRTPICSSEESRIKESEDFITLSFMEGVRRAFSGELAAERVRPKDGSGSKTLVLELEPEKGSSVWTESKVTAARDAAGQIIEFIGVTRDITERKRLEEEKINSERLQTILAMAGTVCHEMHQPMQVIYGYVGLLLLNRSADDPIYRILNIIKSEIERMQGITARLKKVGKCETRDYLGFSKIFDIHRLP